MDSGTVGDVNLTRLFIEMPHDSEKEDKHATSAPDPVSWWQKFHFSGKVIMCSVLFGFGLVLIGGLLLAIGADRHEDGNLNEVQNKAPMSIVGPIIMGIGGFTVFVGIIMCLFETNICRKRQPDSKPLIEDQRTLKNSIPSTTQKRQKHHKKSSPRKHKVAKKAEQNSNHSSPSSIPIDVHRSLSRDLTSSDKFLTPPSSFHYERPKLQPTHSDAENQTSASLMKSFTSSGKSWNTCTEFQTPSSSLQDSSGSFEGGDDTLGISPEPKELRNDRLKSLKHEFVTPKNSRAEISVAKSSFMQETALTKSHQALSNSNVKSKEFHDEITEKLDVLNHDFVTPMNSYVDQPNINSQKWDVPKEDLPQMATKIEVVDNLDKSSNNKSPDSSFDSSVHETVAREVTQTGVSVQEKHYLNNESILSIASDFESKETVSHDLKESNDPILTMENNSHVSDHVVS